MHTYQITFTMPNDNGPEHIVFLNIQAETGEEAAFEAGKKFAHPDSKCLEVQVLD